MITLLVAAIVAPPVAPQGAQKPQEPVFRYARAAPLPPYLIVMKLTSSPTYVNARPGTKARFRTLGPRLPIEGDLFLSKRRYAFTLSSPWNQTGRTIPGHRIEHGDARLYVSGWVENGVSYAANTAMDKTRGLNHYDIHMFSDVPVQAAYRHADARLRALYGPPTKVIRTTHMGEILPLDNYPAEPPKSLVWNWGSRGADTVSEIWCWGRGRFKDSALTGDRIRDGKTSALVEGMSTLVVLTAWGRSDRFLQANGENPTEIRQGAWFLARTTP